KEAHTDSQERLPEYHVKARNTSSSSENKIHDEQIARQYGFRGALVPGVTVYAYLTHPLVEAFGAAWLERGTANVRFLKPIHDGGRAAEYLERVSDGLALYRGARGWVHPGFFLDQANKALSQNVRMSPWIHVGSVVRHLGGARVGETLSTRGRVRSLFEKKGREFVEADLVLVAGERRPIAHVLHTAIYRLPPPAR